jgi:hypothetical protein
LFGCADVELQAAHLVVEAAIRGSTSTKSKARVSGFTLPTLSARIALSPGIGLQVECGHEVFD